MTSRMARLAPALTFSCRLASLRSTWASQVVPERIRLAKEARARCPRFPTKTVKVKVLAVLLAREARPLVVRLLLVAPRAVSEEPLRRAARLEALAERLRLVV